MAYHPLSKESGGSANDRRIEANRILNILQSDNIMERDDLTAEHRKFLRDMFADRRQEITAKILFYLRDLKSQYSD